MSILVTGATGYLGRSVLAELGALDQELLVLVREGRDPGELPRRARVVRGDVASLDDVATAMQGASIVVHMAALVEMDPRDRARVAAVNVGGLRNVVRAASFQSVDRIVYTSTILALGATDGGTGDEERAPVATVAGNLYMATKAEALAYGRDQASQGAPIVFLYPGIVYGPGPRREAGIMVRLLADLMAGRLPATVGPADRRWCHAFTGDVARGHRLAVERAEPGRGYILGGVNATLGEWLALAARLSGSRAPRHRIPYSVATLIAHADLRLARLRGRAPTLTPDAVEVFRHEWAFASERAERELGYTITPLEEGIARTVESLR